MCQQSSVSDYPIKKSQTAQPNHFRGLQGSKHKIQYRVGSKGWTSPYPFQSFIRLVWFIDKRDKENVILDSQWKPTYSEAQKSSKNILCSVSKQDISFENKSQPFKRELTNES